jgi:hypothetical protein
MRMADGQKVMLRVELRTPKLGQLRQSTPHAAMGDEGNVHHAHEHEHAHHGEHGRKHGRKRDDPHDYLLVQWIKQANHVKQANDRKEGESILGEPSIAAAENEKNEESHDYNEGSHGQGGNGERSGEQSLGLHEVRRLRGTFNWSLPAAAALGCWTVVVEWHTSAVRRSRANSTVLRKLLSLDGAEQDSEGGGEGGGDDAFVQDGFPLVRAARFVVHKRIRPSSRAKWWSWWRSRKGTEHMVEDGAHEYEVEELLVPTPPPRWQRWQRLHEAAPHLALPLCPDVSDIDSRDTAAASGVGSNERSRRKRAVLYLSPMVQHMALTGAPVLVLMFVLWQCHACQPHTARCMPMATLCKGTHDARSD